MRWIGSVSRLAAVCWLLLLVAWLAPGAVPTEELRARLKAAPVPLPEPVEVAAVAEPEPPPEPAKEPEPPQEPDPPPQPRPAEPEQAEPEAAAPVDAADLSLGEALLAGAGSFPALSASYEGLRSFAAYAASMHALGGRFVVVQRRAIVGEIDPISGSIREGSVGSRFSPRARDYSGEPALARASAQARARFGTDAVVMLLVPRNLDAGLFGGIARALAERGAAHREFRELVGHYERGPAGELRFRLETAVRRDGTRMALPLLFDLRAIARAGPAGPRA